MMRSSQWSSVACAAAAFTATPAAAGEWDLGAEVQGELRLFPSDAPTPRQFDHVQPSLAFQPEARWESDARTHQVTLVPFFRLDGQDDERTHFDVREAFYRYNSDSNWSLTVGAVKVFWGRTESRHLVDIINQTDAVEDIDEEDKLGQPMVNFSLFDDWGTLDLFVMSGFRDRTFPGPNGRPIFQAAVDTDDPIFTRDGRRKAPDFAARYSHYIGNWDFGASFFYGTSREARLAFDFGGAPAAPTNLAGLVRTLPVYDQITQGSIDFQYTQDAWLWKFEGLVREGQGDTFFAAVGGFEYTLYQLFGTNADLGLLTEYQYDGRDDGIVLENFGDDAPSSLAPGATAALAAPVTIANNDVFMGARLALNDPQDTSFLVGGTIDVDDQSTGVFIEAERRIGQNWKAELETRLFVNVDPTNFAFAFRNEDFVTLRLTRYF